MAKKLGGRCRPLLWLALLVWTGFMVTSYFLLHYYDDQYGGGMYLSDRALAAPVAHLCEPLPTSRQSSCYQDLSATNDAQVRSQFAHLLQKYSTTTSAIGTHNNKKHPLYMMQFHDAAVACALAIDLPKCVKAVLSHPTNVTSTAAEFPNKPLPFRNQLGTVIMGDEHHEFTEEDAVEACAEVQDSVGRLFCEKHFVQLDDEEIAKHYIHMNLDTVTLQDSKPLNEQDAKTLCSSCPFRYYPHCLKAVPLFPNYHVAMHFVQLYKIKQGEVVTEEASQKLCNHVVRRHACIKLILGQPPQVATQHYLTFFAPNALTAVQANAICEVEPELKSQSSTNQTQQQQQQGGECERNVQTMNSVAAAQLYAELWKLSEKEKNESV